MSRIVLLALSVLCAACAPSAPPPPSSDAVAAAAAATLAPTDERLANLYRQSCRACHSIANSGAPLTGDRSQWDARWSKGMPALVQSTVAGLNGMPPGGQCFSCTAADYEALIKFLAGRP
jgi:cytochrome c5